MASSSSGQGAACYGEERVGVVSTLRSFSDITCKLRPDVTAGRQLAKVIEVTKQYLMRVLIAFVRNSNNAPILMTYSNDGTPATWQSRRRLRLRGKRATLHGHRHTGELLSQIVFLRSFDHRGKAKTAALMREPMELKHGKDTWALYSAMRSFCMSLRQMGHKGIAIQHVSFDRALYKPLARVHRQHHKLEAQQQGELYPEEGDLLDLLQWCTSSACSLHDAHGSHRWGLSSLHADQDMLKGLYVSIQSIRNSMDYVYEHIGSWLAAHIEVVEDDDALPSAEYLQRLWTALGAEFEVVSTICDARMHWQGERLCIARSFVESEDDVVDIISGTLLSLWTLRTFSDTRWLGMSSSLRALVGALLSGIDSIVAHICRAPHTLEYHISGWAKLTPEARKFAVVSAMSGYVSDIALQMIMEDNRVPRWIHAIQEAMVEEVEWLAGLEDRLGSDTNKYVVLQW